MWQPMFELGIPHIDDQHKHLVDMVGGIKKLIDQAEAGVDCYDQIKATIDDLVDYTRVHFQDEESYMEDMGYPGIDEHQGKHHDFATKIAMMAASYKSIEQGKVLEDLGNYLLDWVINHILTEDKEYLRYQKGII